MPLYSSKAACHCYEQEKGGFSHHNTGAAGVSGMSPKTTTTPFSWEERCQEAQRKPIPAGEGQERETNQHRESIPTRLAMAPMKTS